MLHRRIPRRRPDRFNRWLTGAVAGRFRHLVDAVVIVKPETIIRWHRAGWRLLWRWRSQRRPPGRPQVDADLRNLIRRLWRGNLTWGQKRIAGDLAKLGYQRDVQRSF